MTDTPEPPAIIPAGPALSALTDEVMARVHLEIERLGAVALADAGVRAQDGWQYDVNAKQVVRTP